MSNQAHQRIKLMAKMEEIQDANYKKFKGQNECELHTREEIADLFFSKEFQPEPPPVSYQNLKEDFSIECTELNDKGVCVVKGTPMDIINWIINYCEKHNLSISSASFLKHLVDVTWGSAFEDQSVPSTHHANYLINLAKETFNKQDCSSQLCFVSCQNLNNCKNKK